MDKVLLPECNWIIKAWILVLPSETWRCEFSANSSNVQSIFLYPQTPISPKVTASFFIQGLILQLFTCRRPLNNISIAFVFCIWILLGLKGWNYMIFLHFQSRISSKLPAGVLPSRHRSTASYYVFRKFLEKNPWTVFLASESCQVGVAKIEGALGSDSESFAPKTTGCFLYHGRNRQFCTWRKLLGDKMISLIF